MTVSGPLRQLGRIVALVLISLLALQLFFVARIAVMAVIDPQSTTFQRSEAWRLLSEHGRIEWDRDGAYAILIPPQGSGYIKLLSDGSYSFRHYAPHGAVMSIGRCS